MAIVLFALASGGCLAVAAGAAGGAAIGYVYCKGKIYDTYNAGFQDTWTATHAALRDLGMPVVSEEIKNGKGTIVSRTANDEKIHLFVDTVDSKIPAEGQMTRVSIRVAVFGDRPVSVRILDQINVHLGPAASAPARVAVPGNPQPIQQTGGFTQPSLPKASETAPPPLLPSEPAPVAK
jgi:hypothetical protein